MRRSISPQASILLLATCVWFGCTQHCVAQSSSGAGQLTGDWLGNRSYLADSGVTFNWDVANFYQGVASGGLDRQFLNGGHGDYVTNFDFGKMGVQEGLFLKIRAEHRYGQTISSDTGAIIPAAVLADLPVSNSHDVYITNFLFTQFLSETFGMFAGKLDTFDGDPNAFASGRGKTQFSNLGFVVNPIALRTVPYSTLGCGFVILDENQQPLFTYTLLNPTDTARTSGFDELFADGVAMSAQLRLPTNFWNKPGHQLFAGTYSNRKYTALGQDPRVILPNIPINQASGSWSLFYNFDQYLFTSADDPTRGWGLFGRAGIADDQANPLARFFSLGLGGSSPFASAPNDSFGVGWFYSGTSNQIGPILQAAFGPIGNGQGIELFYNRQVTPWLNVTPDFQVIIPARENVDTALVAGIRAVMKL